MSRYDVPDPKCQHKPTVMVSSHADIIAAAKTADSMASTHCCSREACQDDAREWVRAHTRRSETYVVPLRGRVSA